MNPKDVKTDLLSAPAHIPLITPLEQLREASSKWQDTNTAMSCSTSSAVAASSSHSAPIVMSLGGGRKRYRADATARLVEELNGIHLQEALLEIGQLPESNSAQASSDAIDKRLQFNLKTDQFTANTHWSVCDASAASNEYYVATFQHTELARESVYHLVMHESDQSGHRMRLYMSSAKPTDRYETLNRTYTTQETVGLAVIQSCLSQLLTTSTGMLIESHQSHHQHLSAPVASSSSAADSKHMDKTPRLLVGYGSEPCVLSVDLAARGVAGHCYIPTVRYVGPPVNQAFNFTQRASFVAWDKKSRVMNLKPTVEFIRAVLEESRSDLLESRVSFEVRG